MVYYYIPKKLDVNYQNKDRTNLENEIKTQANEYLPEIKKLFPELQIRLLWTKKSTFGFAFSDFVKTHKGLTIGKGENDLYNMIKDQYVCIILSDKIEDSFSEVKDIPQGKVFRLNFPAFREYLGTFGKTKDVVSAFLREAFPSEIKLKQLQERMEKGIALDKRRVLEQLLDLVETYPPEKIDDLKILVDRLPNLPKGLKLSTEQISNLLTFISSMSEDTQFTSKNFSKFLSIISKMKQVEFSDEDATNMIGMLDRFSKTYHIKNREELETILGLVINFLEENNLTEPTDFKKFLGSVEKISTHYKITTPEDFKEIMKLCKISDNMIKANYNYFKEKLAEFKVLIDNSATLERTMQDFVTEHRWLLDFKFWSYDEIENEKEIKNIGRIDLYMAKKQIKTTNIAVVEFKKPDLAVVDGTYRPNKPVLTKGTVSALNQTMHYMENVPKESYDNVEGWVIAGRKSDENDYFVDVFNKYVHGIQTKTYQNLYDKAKEIVDAFALSG